MKTLTAKLGNDPISFMGNDVEMSRRIQWSENEFSHSLALEPTADPRFGLSRSVGFAVRPFGGDSAFGR